MKKIKEYIHLNNQQLRIMAGIGISIIFNFIDYSIDSEIKFGFFYLFPLYLVTWNIKKMRYGIWVCVTALIPYLLKEIEQSISMDFTFLWNTLYRLSFLLIFTFIMNKRSMLEEKLMNRTQELARSNNELEQFASIASHDLKEPLRVISQYLQILEQKSQNKLDPSLTKFVTGSVKAAERMYALINDLLDFSKAVEKERAYQLIDISDVLKKVVNNLSAAIEKSGAVIISDSLPALMVAESELTRVFQNLIANAVKYKGANPPRIHISAQRKQNQWVFTVKDNGIGIEAQYYDRVFQMFQRLHTKEEYPGTGIGLAICKKIVENYGGQIWVESEPGRGSTFCFTIPEQGGYAHGK